MYAVKYMEKWFNVNDIPGWCAGGKLSGILDEDIPKINHKTLMEFMKRSCPGASVFVISVNEKEVALIEFLTKNKWIAGPWLKNHGHGGRKTCLFFKQITKASWNANGNHQF